MTDDRPWWIPKNVPYVPQWQYLNKGDRVLVEGNTGLNGGHSFKRTYNTSGEIIEEKMINNPYNRSDNTLAKGDVKILLYFLAGMTIMGGALLTACYYMEPRQENSPASQKSGLVDKIDARN